MGQHLLLINKSVEKNLKSLTNGGLLKYSSLHVKFTIFHTFSRANLISVERTKSPHKHFIEK